MQCGRWFKRTPKGRISYLKGYLTNPTNSNHYSLSYNQAKSIWEKCDGHISASIGHETDFYSGECCGIEIIIQCNKCKHASYPEFSYLHDAEEQIKMFYDGTFEKNRKDLMKKWLDASSLFTIKEDWLKENEEEGKKEKEKLG